MLGAGGTMGKGMARNAAAAQIPVHAWNRTAAKLDDLAATAGIESFATAREAVIDADLVVTMLSDAAATIAAMSGPDGGGAGAEGGLGADGDDRRRGLGPLRRARP